jgi:hypothetical protein
LFKTSAIYAKLARRMAISAIDAYQPESRADFVNAARTIAFSIAALGLLGKTASEGMTMPEQMRAFGRAIALNRSADQSERTMMQRRRNQMTRPPAEQLDIGSEPPASDAEIDDAEMQAGIAGIMKEYDATCRPPATEAAAPEKPPEPAPIAAKTTAPQLPPVVSPVRPAHPVTATSAAAIRSDNSRSGSGQPRTATFREGLLNHTAMQRVIEQSGAQYASVAAIQAFPGR